MKKIANSPAKVAGASLGQSLGPVADAESQKFETQGHLNKLTDAFDIMSDPDKMKRVKALAGRHKKAISSLSDLKQAASNFNAPPESDSDDGSV